MHGVQLFPHAVCIMGPLFFVLVWRVFRLALSRFVVCFAFVSYVAQSICCFAVDCMCSEASAVAAVVVIIVVVG